MFGIDFFKRWSPESARDLLRRGNPPRRMRVNGRLDLANSAWLKDLPSVLIADSIDVSNCRSLRVLPDCVKCNELIVARTSIARLGKGLEVAGRIDATDCRLLQCVEAIQVLELYLRGCTQLEQISEDLKVRLLDVAGCTSLSELPQVAARHIQVLDVSNCTNLAVLPSDLIHLERLNVSGCTRLTSLPEDIRIRSWIDVAYSGLEGTPHSLRSVRLLWRGMPVSDRVAFCPETITAEEIIQEQNLELRRLLIERIGVEEFLAIASAQTLDQDTDPGGSRRLLRVPFEAGEEVVCLEVHCPSTGRKYILRVPPRTITCAEAAAWIAGFNNPRHYRPVVET